MTSDDRNGGNGATRSNGNGGAHEPTVVRAPETENAGGPVAAPKPASGGTYSQGTKSGGEAGTLPSGRLNARTLAQPPGIAFELDGVQAEARPGETIWA